MSVFKQFWIYTEITIEQVLQFKKLKKVYILLSIDWEKVIFINKIFEWFMISMRKWVIKLSHREVIE